MISTYLLFRFQLESIFHPFAKSSLSKVIGLPNPGPVDQKVTPLSLLWYFTPTFLPPWCVLLLDPLRRLSMYNLSSKLGHCLKRKGVLINYYARLSITNQESSRKTQMYGLPLLLPPKPASPFSCYSSSDSFFFHLLLQCVPGPHCCHATPSPCVSLSTYDSVPICATSWFYTPCPSPTANHKSLPGCPVGNSTSTSSLS